MCAHAPIGPARCLRSSATASVMSASGAQFTATTSTPSGSKPGPGGGARPADAPLRGARAAAVPPLAREPASLANKPLPFVPRPLGPAARQVVGAVEEVHKTPPVQLKRVGPEDVRARRD